MRLPDSMANQWTRDLADTLLRLGPAQRPSDLASPPPPAVPAPASAPPIAPSE